MSGDVQPRKRKDKKKKKDDLGVEEPRGTAAAFGEGDVFMHSQSEHGTGGHWCAKVIFFSLLAVLITLVGLIILENRGLTELEANSVESRYSGVLEGWIEDAPDDDHHDEHTLELKHHDEDDADQGSELEHDDEEHSDEEHDDEDHDDEDHDDDVDENDENENDDDEDENDDDKDENEYDNEEADQDADDSDEADNEDADEDEESKESEEQKIDMANDEDDIEESSYRKYYGSNHKANSENDDDVDDHNEYTENPEDEDDEKQLDEDDDDDEDSHDEKHLDHDKKQNYDSFEENDADEDKTSEDNDDDDEDSNEIDDDLPNDKAHENDEEHEEDEEPANIEIETIEKEISDEDAVSTEQPKDTDDDQSQEEELSPNEEDSSVEDDDVEFLEPDELDELPIVEPITAPKGKPLPEVEESPSTEKPQDTLADEEEYEIQQEQLRKEKEQASQGMWLKLTVGGALLVATHAVLRRATASREPDAEEDEQDYREETPLSDRRMTLISEPVPPPTVAPRPEIFRSIEREVKREPTVIVQSSLPTKEEKEDEEDDIIVFKPVPVETPKDTVDKELYSDEEGEEEDEEEEIIEPTKAIPQQAVPQAPHTIDVTKEVTPEPDEDDDVEIIDEEQLEEELEEEEISDVDDAELLSRLEEKYGRLPEPERPPYKDGGNSFEDEWPGEPADAFWSGHLEQAQRELRQGEWTAAVEKASAPSLQSSARARYIVAQALDAAAETNKDNKLLNKAIAAYLELLKMNERLSDKKLLEVASRTLDRIKFRGTYLSAEPVFKLLIRRFPNEPAYRNNLTISLLMANRADLAENVLKETLELWPNDRVALAHLGFILKTLHNRLEEAVEVFKKALEDDPGSANEPRFYYHLGDALLQLGRFDEAHEVHKRAAALGHFLSPSQRSLYNVDRLKSRPWWNVDQTPYSRIALALEKSWKEILKEGEAARAMYEKEKEGLKERGEWSQLDLFVRGREVPNRCSRAPVTCGIVKSELAASGCRRGQIKFSMMEPGTHVRPHVGPTNCRLRMHLGLSNTKNTFIRVDRETRQWQTGKVLIFDDSFEHEVWHNGTGTRLVLIVDVWHPDLTPAERRQLPAI